LIPIPALLIGARGRLVPSLAPLLPFTALCIPAGNSYASDGKRARFPVNLSLDTIDVDPCYGNFDEVLGTDDARGVSAFAQEHRFSCRFPGAYTRAMPLTDDDLFDFDHNRLDEFDLGAAQRRLAEQRDAYRAQLVAARWLDGWRERMEEDEGSMQSEDWHEGFKYAMRETAAHLRQGDLLPGGVLHDETDSGQL